MTMCFLCEKELIPILNPQSSVLVACGSIFRNPQSSIRNPQSSILNPQSSTLLVLNRGQKIYKAEDLEEYSRYGFQEIISIESAGVNLDFETLAEKFPNVRFLLLKGGANGEVNIGEQIKNCPSCIGTILCV